jgi:Protein of unknown function (DUF4238)
MVGTGKPFDVGALRRAASRLLNEEKKRRQHHVWQHYLKSWTVGGQIYCRMDGGIFPTGTTTLAIERDFYKLHKLNAGDISSIKWLVIDPAHPLAKKNHAEFLALLTAPTLFEGRSSEIDAIIDIYRTNALENYHAGIEASFLPLLDRLLEKDTSFYSTDEGCITFLHFICTQHMRTKGIKLRTIELIRQKNGHDLSRIWDIMSHMFAVNIGASLFLQRGRRKLALIENSTDVTFITGDQPVINLLGDGSQPPKTLSLYYPLAPRLALILSEVDADPAYSTDSLTPTQVLALNRRIIEASHSQVFGQSEASISSALRDAAG